MNIIPVIDLLHGQVVHAKLGNRKHYLPIQSRLCTGSDPIAMVEALLQLYPFTRLYMADLDAIQALGSHHMVVADISARYPQLEIWLDAGFTNSQAIQGWQGSRIRPVLGTESLSDLPHYQQLARSCRQRHVLSVDFKAKQYIEPGRQPGRAGYCTTGTIKSLVQHPCYLCRWRDTQQGRPAAINSKWDTWRTYSKCIAYRYYR